MDLLILSASITSVVSVLALPPQTGREEFHLSIEQAMSLALERDPSVDRAMRSQEMAAMGIEDAKAGYWPTISVGLSASQSASGSAYRAQGGFYQQSLSGNFVSSVSGRISVPIDISGSTSSQVEAAKLRRDAANLTAQQARYGASIDIQSSYWAAFRAQKQIEIDKTIVSSLRDLLIGAKKQVPEIVPYLQIELASAEDMLRASEGSADQTADALKLALQLPFDLDLELTSELDEGLALTQEVPESETKPESLTLAVSAKSVESARLSAERIKQRHRPSLNLSAYGSQSFSGKFIDEFGKTSSRSYGFDVGLNFPILNYDSGRSENSERVAEMQVEQAEMDLDLARRRQELQRRQAKLALARAEERLANAPDPEAASRALRFATEALLGSSGAVAPSIIPQVSNARSSWRMAQIAAIDAKVSLIMARLQWARLDS